MITSFILVIAFAAGSDGWEPLSEREGIRTFRKPLAGTRLFALRGEGIVQAKLARIFALRSNPEIMKRYTAMLEDQAVFEEPNRYDRFVWQHFRSPWPLKDRDFVYRVQTYPDPKTRSILVRLNSVERPDVGPQPCCVRAEMRDSIFRYTALRDGSTYVECELTLDPKGSVPIWMVNLVQRDWPYKTLSNMRKAVLLPDVTDLPEFADWHDEAAREAP